MGLKEREEDRMRESEGRKKEERERGWNCKGGGIERKDQERLTQG